MQENSQEHQGQNEAQPDINKELRDSNPGITEELRDSNPGITGELRDERNSDMSKTEPDSKPESKELTRVEKIDKVLNEYFEIKAKAEHVKQTAANEKNLDAKQVLMGMGQTLNNEAARILSEKGKGIDLDPITEETKPSPGQYL